MSESSRAPDPEPIPEPAPEAAPEAAPAATPVPSEDRPSPVGTPLLLGLSLSAALVAYADLRDVRPIGAAFLPSMGPPWTVHGLLLLGTITVIAVELGTDRPESPRRIIRPSLIVGAIGAVVSIVAALAIARWVDRPPRPHAPRFTPNELRLVVTTGALLGTGVAPAWLAAAFVRRREKEVSPAHLGLIVSLVATGWAAYALLQASYLEDLIARRGDVAWAVGAPKRLIAQAPIHKSLSLVALGTPYAWAALVIGARLRVRAALAVSLAGTVAAAGLLTSGVFTYHHPARDGWGGGFVIAWASAAAVWAPLLGGLADRIARDHSPSEVAPDGPEVSRANASSSS